jgi:hypothetical protein
VATTIEGTVTVIPEGGSTEPPSGETAVLGAASS